VNRLQLWKSLFAHPVFASAMRKLRKPEVALCEEFITKHDHLGYADFNFHASRWMLDDANKPKNHNTMYAMVMAANPLPPDLSRRKT